MREQLLCASNTLKWQKKISQRFILVQRLHLLYFGTSHSKWCMRFGTPPPPLLFFFSFLADDKRGPHLEFPSSVVLFLHWRPGCDWSSSAHIHTSRRGWVFAANHSHMWRGSLEGVLFYLTSSSAGTAASMCSWLTRIHRDKVKVSENWTRPSPL